jgi:hypothetical protein
MARPDRKLRPAKGRAGHIWPRHPDDWYVEEPWVSAALIARVGVAGPLLDPACGFGRIVRAALAAGISARGSDIVPRWRLAPKVGDPHSPSHERFYAVCDFLNGHWPPKRGIWSDPAVIMSNPPFRKVRAFYDAAIARAEAVILLLPFTWYCGAGTSAWLETTPLRFVYPLGPRASMPPGDYLLAGHTAQGGRADYAWYEWHNGVTPVARGGRRPQILALRRDPSRGASREHLRMDGGRPG